LAYRQVTPAQARYLDARLLLLRYFCRALESSAPLGYAHDNPED